MTDSLDSRSGADLLRTQLRSLVDTAGTPIVCLDEHYRVSVFNPAAERVFGRRREEIVGRSYTDLLPHQVREKVAGDLQRVLAGEPIEHFENVIRSTTGGESVVLWNLARIAPVNGGRPGIVAVGQDITGIQRMQDRLIRQTRHLLGLTRIDRAIIALQPPHAIAAAALHHVKGLVECDGIAVIGFDMAAGQAVRLAMEGCPRPEPPEVRPLEPADGAEPVWPDSGSAPFAVPLVANGVRLGTLLITCNQGVNALTLVAIESIGQVADRLAIALDNARLLDAERRARRQFQDASARLVEIQETERRRIARELHDDIGQGLTALKLDLEMQSRARGESDRTLQATVATVHTLIERVRSLSLDLRPPVLDDLGLIPALQSLIAHYAAQTGIKVTLDGSGIDRRLRPDVETAAFRIVQEALTNVARHAGVSQAFVHLDVAGSTLLLIIEDCGRGFDPAAASAAKSCGLSNMRDRAAMLNGHLTVESTVGAGTRVSARIPAS